jgi:hypothetical protein
MFLLSGIPTVKKKNHHSWIEARHDSSSLPVRGWYGKQEEGAVRAAPIKDSGLPPLASLYKCTISFDGKHRIGLGASRCSDY